MSHRTTSRRLACVLAGCGAAWSAAHGQTVWTGAAGDGLWSTVGNWNPMQLPGMADTVSIPANAPGCVANIQANIAGLNALSGLTVRAPVTVTGPSSAVNLFIEPGGNILNSSGSPFPITGVCLVNGTLSSGAFSTSGTMTISVLSLINSSVVNTGTANVQTMLSAGGGTFTNSGTMDFQNEGDAQGNASVNGVRNLAMLRKSGTGESLISCKYEQLGGSTTVEVGTLKFRAAQTAWSAGSVIVSGGTFRLELGGHLFAGLAGISGAGNIEISAGGTVGAPGVQITQDLEIAATSIATISNTVTRLDAELRNNGNMVLGSNASFIGPGVLRNMAGRSILVTGQTSFSTTGLLNEGALIELGGTITISGGSTITNGPGSTVRVSGSQNINNAGGGTNQLTNHGGLEKTGPGNAIIAPRFRQACGTTDVLSGSLELTGGGTFDDDVTVSRAAADAILALTGGSFTFADAVHIFTGEGVVQFGEIGSSPTFNVTASGGLDLDMDLAGAGHCLLSLGQLGGDGLIQQNGRFYCGGGTLGLLDGAVWKLGFVNEGEFICGNPPGQSQSGPTIRGGTFTNNGIVYMTTSTNARDGAQVINNNRWIAEENVSSTLLITAPAALINNGRFEKTQGGTVSVSGAFDNQGEVVVLDGALAFQSGITQFQAGVMTGGRWEARPGTLLDLPIACTRLTSGAVMETGSAACPDLRPCSMIDDGAALVCNDDFASTASSCSLLEEGSLTVKDHAEFTCEGPVNNGMIGQSVLSWVEQTTVIGPGPPPPGLPRIVTPTLNNRGQIRPGGNGTAGPFNLTGALNCFEESVLQIELGGGVPGTAHDQIAVTGDASIDGALHVSLLDGYEPQSGQAWVILTSTGSVTGAFDTVAGPTPPPGHEWRASIHDDHVQLRLACRADFDESGGLNVPDIFSFLSAWFAQEPNADFDGDTVITVPDIFAFLSAWFAGCGGA